MFPKRVGNERQPARRLVGIGVDMLMRHAAGPHRQQNQIAGFPIDLLLVGGSVTFAFETADEPARFQLDGASTGNNPATPHTSSYRHNLKTTRVTPLPTRRA